MPEKDEKTKNLKGQSLYKGSAGSKISHENEYLSKYRCCQKCAAGTHASGVCTTSHDLSSWDPCRNCEDFTEAPNELDRSLTRRDDVVLSVFVGICIVVICILVFFFFCYKRKKDEIKPEDAEIQPFDKIVRSDSEVLKWSNKYANILLPAETDPEINSEATKCDDQCEALPAEMDDKGWSHVYICLKETVPPSRWKELIRLLGLADVNIETISMDYQNDVSEQNYQMLLAWRKQEGRRATVGAIYDVLKVMKLPDCRYRIEEALKGKRIPIA
ncbi:tumor necrosis factor receptor superfamily member 10B-like isoform X2 [Eleutherodactylus coqui]